MLYDMVHEFNSEKNYQIIHFTGKIQYSITAVWASQRISKDWAGLASKAVQEESQWHSGR